MSQQMKRDRSRYVQIRLVATYERGGILSWRIQGKEYQDAWDEHSVLEVGELGDVRIPLSVHDVKSMIVQVLHSQLIDETVSVFTDSGGAGPASPEGTTGGQ